MSNNRIKILAAFTAVYFVWGSTYVAARIGIATIPPFLLSSVRFFIAGSLLMIWCLLTNKKFPDAASLINNSICGILMLGGGTVSIAWAEQYVPSSTAAIIVAFLPLWFILLDKKQWNYYFSNKAMIAGILLGFAGVVLLTKFSGTDTSGLNKPGHAAFGIIAILSGGIAWTIGSLMSKYRTTNTSLFMNGSIQLLATSICCLLISALTGELKTFAVAQVSSQSAIALLYLIVMGSMATYLSYIYLLNLLPAVQVSTYVYINPIIAVLLGAAIANEKINTLEVLALFIILCGVLLVNMPKYLAFKRVTKTK
jgi:drug/metabolite transporter (DMT)-like permease